MQKKSTFSSQKFGVKDISITFVSNKQQIQTIKKTDMKTTKYYIKQKTYGAGYPALPNKFAVNGTEKQIRAFFKEHETTHARFIESEFSAEEIEFMDVFDCDL